MERCRNIRGFEGLASYDRVICRRAPQNIVRFNSQNFLQGMSGSITFQCPYFHFSESLPSTLSFSSQWLLGNKEIRPDGALMNFVFYHMIELKHINFSDCDFLVEFISLLPSNSL